jgi:formiminotetrahydrofolate cyclodeaminase
VFGAAATARRSIPIEPDRLNSLPARELLERMASGDPIPGGGSAAALAGAMGAALMRMVVTLTSGRPAAADHEDELTEIAVAAATLQSELLNLVELDAVAYDAVIRARRLPRDTDLERQARAVQVAAAVREATRAPLQTARLAERVLGLGERLAPIGSRNAISDVGVGALLATAALRGAVLNVRINLPSLDDDDELRTEATTEVARLLEGLDERERAIRDRVEGMLG